MRTSRTGTGCEGRVRWSRRLGAVVMGCTMLSLAGLGHGSDEMAHESLEISDLYLFNTDIKADGATILVRDFDRRVVDIDLYTKALEPGWAYSIWIAVFNNPEHCSDPCGIDDLPGPNPDADPRVRPSVFYGGGLLADASGYGTASTRVVVGKTHRELFGGTDNHGLQRLRKAHIHVVLRSHGEALVGGIGDQIGTANGTCNTPDGCQNVLASFHPPIE